MELNLEKIKKYGFKTPKKEALEYDQEELQKGIEIEQEHTDDEDIAMIIATHHLDEIPNYYTRLEKMEQEYKNEQEPANEDIRKIAQKIN